MLWTLAVRRAWALVLLSCSSAPLVVPDATDDAVTPPPDASPPRDCTRLGQSRTASAALFDAFIQTKDVDTFLSDVAKNGGAPLEDPKSDRVIFLARGAPP